MQIEKMTVKQFERLPHRKWDEPIICDGIVILPVRPCVWSVVKYRARVFLARLLRLSLPEVWEPSHMHDSGFRCMDFVAVSDFKPICLLSGCSDVIHINGVGGYGEGRVSLPRLIPPIAWSVDCLPKSGLLRLWPNRHGLKCDIALSSFEIYVIPKEKTNDKSNDVF